ncbi:hypothetical protein L2E82_05549 [Cichorium intybus]|uniref:Uncharacterized protein n=1 Tax=Cichorium intybus TaxID=13427 RepID=A0ACB9H8P3_CICIN|nr:hypothetical protein L2E82_05549 [Cichorium intybus]
MTSNEYVLPIQQPNREYMVNELQIEESKVPEMCAQLYKAYGTTMAGLRALGYDFDYDEYHRFSQMQMRHTWQKFFIDLD